MFRSGSSRDRAPEIPSSMSRSTSTSLQSARKVDGAGLLRWGGRLSCSLHARQRRRLALPDAFDNVAALDGLSGSFLLRPAGSWQSRASARAQPASFRLCGWRRRTFRSAPPATPGRISRSRCRARRSIRCEPRASTSFAWRVFPKHYVFNENEPLHDIYERGADGALDFDRPNAVAFRHFETQVAALARHGSRSRRDHLPPL